MCFVIGKWQLIYADNSCPGYIGIYSQVGLGLYITSQATRHLNQIA